MSVRFLSNAGRIIMSKAGYEASPALADTNKLFDSEWGATGLVIATGTATRPSGNTNFLIPFPYALHYEPAAYAYGTSQLSLGLVGYPVYGYTTKNELVITPQYGQSFTFRYIIYGVSI